MRANLLLLAGLTGCISHWQAQAGPPGVVVNRSSATQFRVTRSDGTRVIVERPRILGDSLIGSLEPTAPWPGKPARIAISLSDIQSIAQKEADVTASVVLGTLISLTLTVLLSRGIDQ